MIARQGGTVAGNTRKEIEAKTGKKIISQLNAKSDKSLEEAKRNRTELPARTDGRRSSG